MFRSYADGQWILVAAGITCVVGFVTAVVWEILGDADGLGAILAFFCVVGIVVFGAATWGTNTTRRNDHHARVQLAQHYPAITVTKFNSRTETITYQTRPGRLQDAQTCSSRVIEVRGVWTLIEETRDCG